MNMKRTRAPFSEHVTNDTYAQSRARIEYCKQRIEEIEAIEIPGQSNIEDWKLTRLRELRQQIGQAKFHQQVKADIFCNHCDFDFIVIAINDPEVKLSFNDTY